MPFLFRYRPSAVPDFGLVVDRNRRPDRARGIRHGTRRNRFPFTSSVHGRAYSKILLGVSSEFPSLLLADVSCIGDQIDTAMTLRAVFRRKEARQADNAELTRRVCRLFIE
jgi:hypothetical protein